MRAMIEFEEFFGSLATHATHDLPFWAFFDIRNKLEFWFQVCVFVLYYVFNTN